MSTIVLPKSALRKRSRCYWETRSNVKEQHAPTRTDNQSQNMKKEKKKKKKKKKKKTSPFVADFGCNRQIWISFNDCDDICDPK